MLFFKMYTCYKNDFVINEIIEYVTFSAVCVFPADCWGRAKLLSYISPLMGKKQNNLFLYFFLFFLCVFGRVKTITSKFHKFFYFQIHVRLAIISL